MTEGRGLGERRAKQERVDGLWSAWYNAGRRKDMTVARAQMLDEISKVSDETLMLIYSCIGNETKRHSASNKALRDFVIKTERGNAADEYVRELRDNDRI